MKNYANLHEYKFHELPKNVSTLRLSYLFLFLIQREFRWHQENTKVFLPQTKTFLRIFYYVLFNFHVTLSNVVRRHIPREREQCKTTEDSLKTVNTSLN